VPVNIRGRRAVCMVWGRCHTFQPRFLEFFPARPFRGADAALCDLGLRLFATVCLRLLLRGLEMSSRAYAIPQSSRACLMMIYLDTTQDRIIEAQSGLSIGDCARYNQKDFASGTQKRQIAASGMTSPRAVTQRRWVDHLLQIGREQVPWCSFIRARRMKLLASIVFGAVDA
jgi:hypothetical protein